MRMVMTKEQKPHEKVSIASDTEARHLIVTRRERSIDIGSCVSLFYCKFKKKKSVSLKSKHSISQNNRQVTNIEPNHLDSGALSWSFPLVIPTLWPHSFILSEKNKFIRLKKKKVAYTIRNKVGYVNSLDPVLNVSEHYV